MTPYTSGTAGTTTAQKYALDGWNAALGASPIGNENWNVWADLNADNTLQTRYVRGDGVDQVFAEVGSSTHWTLTDSQGSVRDVITNSATVVDSISYTAFGSPIETSPGDGGRYLYTGREFDVETGLQYNRARYYDSTMGRWISQDPLQFNAGDSNLYRYVNNAPTNATDPSGSIPLPEGTELKFQYLKTVVQFEIDQKKKIVKETKVFVPAGGIMKVIGYQFAAPTKPEIGKESIAYTTVIYTYNAPEKTKESMKIGNDTYYKFNQIFFISSISVNVIKKAGNNDTNDAIAKTIDFASNFVPGKVIMQTGGWAISVALQKQLQQNEADLKVEIKTLSSIARIGYITSYWGKDGRPVSLFPDVKLPAGVPLGEIIIPGEPKNFSFNTTEEATKYLADYKDPITKNPLPALFLGLGLEQ